MTYGEEIRKAAMATTTKATKLSRIKEQFVGTGCTLLNLAISGHPFGGYMKGKYYYFVGDSTSGKTFFCMTCFAEAAKNKAFSDYRFIYDNVEDGMLMDVDKFFGVDAGDRIEAPAYDEDEDPEFSTNVEEFYYNLDDAFEMGEPFIYILDSMDGLGAVDDEKKFDKAKKAYRGGTQEAGSYGMAKAKKNSTTLRTVVSKLRDSGSILIIISQTRANTNAMGPFSPQKTRSGGHALRFYATVEIWTSLAGAIKKTVRKKSRKIGNKIKIVIKKNRVTGQVHEVWSAIYPSYGVDDVGSCIDYLLGEKWWKKKGQKILAKELGEELTREKLIQHIEKSGKALRMLRKTVGVCWDEIQAACALDRPQRYS